MKVKILPREDLANSGDMFLIDNARMAVVGFDLGAPFLREEDPARIIVCHPSDQPQLEELIAASDSMELI